MVADSPKEQQIPAAVLRRDDEGGPLPQMVAQHREQLRQEREATPSSNPRRFVLTRDPIRPLGVAMEHAKTGPWVPWEDCEVLIRERDEARDEAERMRRTRDEEIRRLRDDVRDAARYRHLRERLACDRLAARKLVITTEGGREPYRTLREAELDREIDECIGLSVEPRETPTPQPYRVRLLKDIFDDGQDHHPPGYVGRKGDVVVIHSIQTAVVSHHGTSHGFVVHDGELELMRQDETTEQLGLQVANGRLKAALIYACFAQHKTRQYMLPEGVTLINGDAVEVTVNGVKVYAGPDRSSPEEPRETSARDILQRLVDTCDLATGAPWPALDEARAFLSGSPEEPTRRLPPREFDIDSHMGLYTESDEALPGKASGRTPEQDRILNANLDQVIWPSENGKGD